jgi:hypothetical protein
MATRGSENEPRVSERDADVTTAVRKSEGAVSGAPLNRPTTNVEPFSSRPVPEPNETRGRLTRLVIRDDVFFDPDCPTHVKLILGACAPHRYKPPTRGEILAALPFLSERDHARAMKHIAANKLAWVDRRLNAMGGPIRLRRLAPLVNTWETGNPRVHVPVAPLARLGSGRGVEEAVLLFGLYHLEQHRRGAAQLGDEAAGFLLGWKVGKVRRWRKILTERALIREAKPRGGRDAPVFVIDEAITAADLNRFDPVRTRKLVPIAVGDTMMKIYATGAEADVVEIRLAQAGSAALEQVASLAPCVRAGDVLDGPLTDLSRMGYRDAYELAAIETAPLDNVDDWILA